MHAGAAGALAQTGPATSSQALSIPRPGARLKRSVQCTPMPHHHPSIASMYAMHAVGRQNGARPGTDDLIVRSRVAPLEVPTRPHTTMHLARGARTRETSSMQNVIMQQCTHRLVRLVYRRLFDAPCRTRLALQPYFPQNHECTAYCIPRPLHTHSMQYGAFVHCVDGLACPARVLGRMHSHITTAFSLKLPHNILLPAPRIHRRDTPTDQM